MWHGSRYADPVLIVTDRQRALAIGIDDTRELDPTDLASVPMPRPSPGVGFQVFPDWQGRGGVTVALAPALLDATSGDSELPRGSS